MNDLLNRIKSNKCIIVAELSANHLHDFNITMRTIEAAYESGADAFKIQTLKPETMTIDCDNQYFKITGGTLWDGKKLIELYNETPLPYEWHAPIFEKCNKLGMLCFSTPYDLTALEFLEAFDVPAYKVASFEITDIPLITEIAKKNKPIILSTGIALLEEIEDAISACKEVGNDNIFLLKCTSAYPAQLEDMNIATMVDMKKRFNVEVGLSDHCLDNAGVYSAVALGAKIVEKHFILDRKLGGPDAAFSIEPNEFKEMVINIRKIEKTLGKVDYSLSEKVKNNIQFKRSLFYIKDIQKGEIITEQHVRSIRPGFGLKPKFLKTIIGSTAMCDIKRGQPVTWESFNEYK